MNRLKQLKGKLWPILLHNIVVQILLLWSLLHGLYFLTGHHVEKVAASALFLYRLGGASFEFSLLITATSTNNQVEYGAVLKGIKLLREIKADVVEIFGDSMLVVN
jgi:hypothetical protein